MFALSCSKSSSHYGHFAHTLNLSTQSNDMQSSQHNSQRVLGKASWSRKCFKELKNSQGTNSAHKSGPRGINTQFPKTSRYNYQSRSVRPVWLESSRCTLDRSDRSGPENPKPKLRCLTWPTKLTLDHPSSTKVISQRFSLRVLTWVTYEHF